MRDEYSDLVDALVIQWIGFHSHWARGNTLVGSIVIPEVVVWIVTRLAIEPVTRAGETHGVGG